MKQVKEQVLTGERALFKSNGIAVENCIFQDGESPLKESKDITVTGSVFRWKYPLWYCENVVVNNTTLTDTARSGIWYTNNLEINDTVIQAPKAFRRCHNVTLNNVEIPNAEETFWNCNDITLNHVNANGNYFGFNSTNITLNNFTLTGNYGFDGAKNIEVHNAKLISKDAFWNCENVTVYDSTIIGEYIGWNSKNIKFVNCTIESLQGFCYMDDVVLENCTLMNTSLAFEYSTVEAAVNSTIDSVLNPISGHIKAKAIKELTLNDTDIDPTNITVEHEYELEIIETVAPCTSKECNKSA